ncbi:pyrroline-5-carboxylate dehydrogenase [Photobacterium angustum]|uniref:bifunctional proline dehydrogenase/L-glutamate gamma-semialdehyde dehydrogenase PutA n=1 Tax=Photobacterium angustum TaxID=661 RepID=UPI0005DCD4F4|nr:bifunctional proline dehydrogenase/L-glutamate gamma-semialdehyde dehydrogenase PutA [Photobacterium angustum]KJF95911.1 pyrroline-5-carboxylate dehydrogenase [Photobacterium angustum]KJG06973.1 pyrroline-5-carboxylate dehydrogenase [Photobacterium angustum]PSV95067.1 bifunctional proline dehydrogenase/L-glutamate gamma-semialdehyde dehydrogenase PutA [Photobacterium angustum]PSW80139.1 bifunctional proline dehydrogenase/L-glutamate gamma-semialdehyde dehydrogenase PutA [Photobacterium angus
MFKAVDVLHSSFIEKPLAQLWALISPLYAVDESEWLTQLLPLAEPTDEERAHSAVQASELIARVRADKNAVQMIDALLLEYSLETKEGILLMCLAEALMRIPDPATADALIRDKLSVADWKSHLKNSDSLFVNASTWGLMLTGKVVTLDAKQDGTPTNVINRLVNKMSEPMIRQAMHQAMKIMGHQFVLGRDISEAMKNGKPKREQGFTYSFDMLGEAALTSQDAEKYYNDYLTAIKAVGKVNSAISAQSASQSSDPTVSIKLSALHPRYEVANEARVLEEMYHSVLELLIFAREHNVGITIDAEEADRLELSLKLFEKLYRAKEVKGWGRFGLVVQAYSKRALPVLAWLAALSKQQGDVIPLRLVKGAYWDSELKLCQQAGFNGYPVFTRKEATDSSYLACARFLLSEPLKGLIYPQFATHNAHTISAIVAMAKHSCFEFQRLHGMGDALYNHVMDMHKTQVRIYAPVGSHKDLLPYLVRRLLENGANSSFVHRLVDANCPISDLTQHPVDVLKQRKTLHNSLIPLPKDIFGSERKNSSSINIDIESQWQPFHQAVHAFDKVKWKASPILNGKPTPILAAERVCVTAPYDREEVVGELTYATSSQVDTAMASAHDAFADWSQCSASERANYLLLLADKLELHQAELVALCHREAGKTIHDAIDEIREAVDFCRYYAEQAQTNFDKPKRITSFDGVDQEMTYQGRGVFVCISPWNFPLAIFLGQVCAALVAGNTVVAKPAEQTSLIACRAIELLLLTGIPQGVIQVVTGLGREIGHQLTSDERVAGVAFTGSTPTAQLINRTLMARDCAPVPFIAETGGQNAMIVDSTALPEQVVRDVLRSAFASAGQRCSALRVLFIQQDIAERVITLIKGAMAELKVGDPQLHATDVGPVIDLAAKQKLLTHIESLKNQARLICQTPLPESCASGDFVPPTAIEIQHIDLLEQEHFGPILHIVRFKASEIDQVVNQINQTGFGLTMGIHSRNERTYSEIASRAKVGNCYINRDQVGAVVGVQPFGGRGLSGTGPKAGGPHYLYRFMQSTIAPINVTHQREMEGTNNEK